MNHLIKNTAKILTAFSLTLILAACGGGGTYDNTSLSSVTGSVAPATATTTTTTGAVTLSWTPPLENTNGSALINLTGYKIYYGTSPGSLTNMVALNNGGLTSYVIDGLTTNTVYYFAITAINSDDIQSGLSNIATKDITS